VALLGLDKGEETSSKLTSGVNKRDEGNGVCGCVNAIVSYTIHTAKTSLRRYHLYGNI
jgi:hypothetical protein